MEDVNPADQHVAINQTKILLATCGTRAIYLGFPYFEPVSWTASTRNDKNAAHEKTAAAIRRRRNDMVFMRPYPRTFLKMSIPPIKVYERTAIAILLEPAACVTNPNTAGPIMPENLLDIS